MHMFLKYFTAKLSPALHGYGCGCWCPARVQASDLAFFVGVGGGGTRQIPLGIRYSCRVSDSEAQQLLFTFATYGPLGGPSMGKILGADCSTGQGWQHFQLARI